MKPLKTIGLCASLLALLAFSGFSQTTNALSTNSVSRYYQVPVLLPNFLIWFASTNVDTGPTNYKATLRDLTVYMRTNIHYAEKTNASVVGSLAVTGQNDGVILAVRGFSGQTNDVFEVQDESNNSLFGVAYDGSFNGLNFASPTNEPSANDILKTDGNTTYWGPNQAQPLLTPNTSVTLSNVTAASFNGDASALFGTNHNLKVDSTNILFSPDSYVDGSDTNVAFAVLNTATGVFGAGSNLSNVIIKNLGSTKVLNAVNADVAASLSGTISGTSFSHARIEPTSQATNFVIDFGGAIYQRILATNAVNFASFANSPGAIGVKVLPNGANRILTFPTNWCWVSASTNWLTVSGSFYTCTLTNGARVGWLSLVADGSDPTNAVASFSITQ